ncbi:MAG: DedA family protein [Pseudomonadota bacterium]
MEYLHPLIHFILHLDQYLINMVDQYGTWTYAILFLIIFCETGLVVLPFLPGDSLLFATGALAASAGALDINILFGLLVVASFTGNATNYFIGKLAGPKVFYSPDSLLLNKNHLIKASDFYRRYGAKTIIIARFIPIIRTFAPFVAGIGSMNKRSFFTYNLIGAILWIGVLLYTSYLFGNQPFIKTHFSTIIIAVIFISLIPAIVEILRQTCQKPAKII